MEHITDQLIEQKSPTAVTLGNFDGIHRGHRALIQLTKEFAQREQLKSVVFSFHPHPMFLFKNREYTALILSYAEKQFMMESMGIDSYIEYPFDKEFAAISPEEFANELVFGRLNCKVLIVGENYKFGAKQKGDFQLLKRLGEQKGVKVINVPSVLYQGRRVSSTRIRDCLVEKKMEEANHLLTVPFFVMGEVIQGKKLGRTIGFPTINIMANPLKLLPPDGVYATKTIYNKKIYSGVTNIGYNPTVNGAFKMIETFLFDFHEIVYGEVLKTHFFKRIRNEHKFPNVDMLRDQMQKDAKSAQLYFESPDFEQWREKYS